MSNLIQCQTGAQLLEHAIKGVIAQGKPSRGGKARGSSCAYRGDNGLKCAVGICIDDEHYQDRMEGFCPTTKDECLITSALQKSHPNINFNDVLIGRLKAIQNCHDIAANGNYFVDSFKTQIIWAVDSRLLPDYCLVFIKSERAQ